MDKIVKMPHIGQMLRQHLEENGLSQAAWARKQGITSQAVARFLREGNIKLDNLFTICQVLNYNFFKALATTLPADLPPHHTTESDAQIQALQQQVRDREIEIKALKEALGLVGGR